MENKKKKLKVEHVEETEDVSTGGFFGKTDFSSLEIDTALKAALKDDMGYDKMTEIQSKSIPVLLQGRDLLGAAKTGSGKTLAFLVPCVEMLIKNQFAQEHGTGVIVISPTRELSLQIFNVATELTTRLASLTLGLVIGGNNRKLEAGKLNAGVNIIVATPGRLLDHLLNTKNFKYNRLRILTIDEADRLLQIGFEEELTQILKLLPRPPQRQTILFSATQTSKVQDLAKLSLTQPLFIQTSTTSTNSSADGEEDSNSTSATVSGLEQGYVLYINVLGIHGRKKQNSRMSIYYQFIQAEKGVLLCTDVAARGLDIPKVDWIVQYDPPDDPKEYIHRVGRTARGADAKGKALLFLMESEKGFIKYLNEYNVKLDEYVFNNGKIANIQLQLERLVEKNYFLHTSCRDAYKSYIHAYASHSLKEIFNVEQLDLQDVAKGFGFSAPPKVEFNIKYKVSKKKNGRQSMNDPNEKIKKRRIGSASGHAFSADNPYGRRHDNDRRQFSK